MKPLYWIIGAVGVFVGLLLYVAVSIADALSDRRAQPRRRRADHAHRVDRDRAFGWDREW